MNRCLRVNFPFQRTTIKTASYKGIHKHASQFIFNLQVTSPLVLETENYKLYQEQHLLKS